MKKTTLVFMLFLSNFVFAQTHIIFHDDFDDNGNRWLNYGEGKINNGFFELGSLSYNIFRRQALNIDENEDFIIEAEATEGNYGIFWGSSFYSQEKFYCFEIQNGKFRIFSYYIARTTTIKDWTNSNSIKSKTNNLKIQQSNNKLHFFINDEEVYTTENLDFYGSCIGVRTARLKYAKIDYFTVYQEIDDLNLISDTLFVGTTKHNLGTNVNSQYIDKNPKISADGRTLYFTREDCPENIGGNDDRSDVWVSHLQDDGTWTKAVNIGRPINNAGPNWVGSVNGNLLLLGNQYSAKGDSLIGGGMSVSRKTANGWTVPEAVVIKDYQTYSSYASVYLLDDNVTLVMASNPEGSFGGRDLYVSFLQDDGSFSTPLNMGNVVNTPAHEHEPFVAADGVTMFFTSMGHPGYGNADVFMSKRLDDTWTNWTEPVNIGTVINSNLADGGFKIPASGDYIYFDTQEDAIGAMDILE